MLPFTLVVTILIGYSFISRFVFNWLHKKEAARGDTIDQTLLSVVWPISVPFYFGVWLADSISWLISLIHHGLHERGPMDE